jgi:hypothetical protein
MHLLSPGVLAEACGFSVAACATGLVLGLLLWLLGWRGHRFWIVLIATVSAGIWGLYSGPAFGAQPMAAGLLLAIAAGTLALALVRVVAFAAGGLAIWLVLRVVTPSWDDPLVCFLAGGLIGLVLFRLWTMALTSFAGTLLMGYSGLCLAHALGKLDAVAFSENNATLLNAACGGVALTGLALQFLLDRRLGGGKRHDSGSGGHFRNPPGRGQWWNVGQWSYRRAG